MALFLLIPNGGGEVRVMTTDPLRTVQSEALLLFVMRVCDRQCAESGTELQRRLGYRPHSQR